MFCFCVCYVFFLLLSFCFDVLFVLFFFRSTFHSLSLSLIHAWSGCLELFCLVSFNSCLSTVADFHLVPKCGYIFRSFLFVSFFSLICFQFKYIFSDALHLSHSIACLLAYFFFLFAFSRFYLTSNYLCIYVCVGVCVCGCELTLLLLVDAFFPRWIYFKTHTRKMWHTIPSRDASYTHKTVKSNKFQQTKWFSIARMNAAIEHVLCRVRANSKQYNRS